MKRPRKLTAAQERRLHAELSVDDLLFRKFEYLMDEVLRYRKSFESHSQVREVLVEDGSGVLYRLMILRIERLPFGQRVIVAGHKVTVGKPPKRGKR